MAFGVLYHWSPVLGLGGVYEVFCHGFAQAKASNSGYGRIYISSRQRWRVSAKGRRESAMVNLSQAQVSLVSESNNSPRGRQPDCAN